MTTIRGFSTRLYRVLAGAMIVGGALAGAAHGQSNNVTLIASPFAGGDVVVSNETTFSTGASGNISTITDATNSHLIRVTGIPAAGFSFTNWTGSLPSGFDPFSNPGFFFGDGTNRIMNGIFVTNPPPAAPALIIVNVDTSTNFPGAGTGQAVITNVTAGTTSATGLVVSVGTSTNNQICLAAIPGGGSIFYKWGGDIPAGLEFIQLPCFISDGQNLTISVIFSNGDLDGDGLPDSWEIQNGLDPESSAGNDGAGGDPDNDDLSNLQEYNGPNNGNPGGINAGLFTSTDPRDPDTDGDGMNDGWESFYGLDPNDGTGANGPLVDIDNDLLLNIEEYLGANGIAPIGFGLATDATNPQNVDTDFDLLADGWEVRWLLDPNDVTSPNGTSHNTDNDLIPSEATTFVTAWPLSGARLLDGYNTGPDFDNLLEFAGLDGIWMTNFLGAPRGDDPRTDPLDVDTDNDTMPDGWEYYFWRWRGAGVGSSVSGGGVDVSGSAFDPFLTGSPNGDVDGDELTNIEEFNAGTDPTHCDTDRDGMDDKWELDNGFNPLNPNNAGQNPDGDFMAQAVDGRGSNIYHLAVYLNGAPSMESGDTAFHPETAWGGVTHPDTVRYNNIDEYLGCNRIPRVLCDTNGIATSFDPDDDDTSPLSFDSDGDTIPDGWECYVGLIPTNVSGSAADDAGFDIDDDDATGAANLSAAEEWANNQDANGNPNIVWPNKLWPTDPGVRDTGTISRVFAWQNVWYDDNGDGIYDAGETQLFTGGWIPGKTNFFGGHADGWTTPTGTVGRINPTCPTVVNTIPSGGIYYEGPGGFTGAEAVWIDNSSPLVLGTPGVFNLGIDTVLPVGSGVAPADLTAGVRTDLRFYHNDFHPRDTDFDGSADSSERSPNGNPTSADTDTDYLPDGWEVYAGTDVTNRDASVGNKAASDTDIDPDDDGLPNFLEYWTGTVPEWMHIDPTWPDYPGRMATRITMRWDLGGGGSGSALRAKTIPLPFIIPPDFASCPSFSIYAGQKASSAKGGKEYHTTKATDADTDDDAQDDYWEAFHGLNPTKGKDELMVDADARNNSGAVVGLWDADTSTIGRFEIGIVTQLIPVVSTVPYLTASNAIADLRAGFAPLQVGPFNFGLENMDEDADGIINFEEYSYEDLSGGGRAVHHTDPSSYSRTDPYGTTFTNGLNYSFTLLNYTFDNGLFSSPQWDWVDGASRPFPFAFENTEGFDTDNDIHGDLSEIAKIGEPLYTPGNSDPINSLDPVRNRAVRLTRANQDFLRTLGAWQVVSPVNFFTRYTIEAWVDPVSMVSTSKTQVIAERAAQYLTMFGTLTRANFRIGINTSNRTPFVQYNGVGTFESAVVSADPIRALASNEWAHIAGVYDGTKLYLYINGEMVKSASSAFLPANGVGTVGGGTVVFYPGTTIIGASEPDAAGPTAGLGVFDSLTPLGTNVGATSFFDGYVDEVRVWNGARTQSAIQGTLNKKLSRTQAAEGTNAATLTHYFNFDDVPDPLVGWTNGVNEPVVPNNLAYLQGSPLQFHQTIAIWSNTLQHSLVYTGSASQVYNYIVFAEDLRAHVALVPPEDDYINFNGGTNTAPSAYKNSSNPYWNSRINFGNGYDLLFMNGAVADGDIFANISWLASGVLADPDGSDADGDTLPDNWETQMGLDPFNGSGNDGPDGDPDGDGLTNWYEYQTGNDPFSTDTNGNGISDEAEDFDSDGLQNLFEVTHGTMANKVDTDDDGLGDGEEQSGQDNLGGAVTANSPSGQTDPLNSLDPVLPKSMSFDGTDRVIIPPQDKYLSETFTIQLWVKPTTAPALGVDRILFRRHVRDTVTGEAGANYEVGVSGTADPLNVLPYIQYNYKLGTNALATYRMSATNYVQPGCVPGIPLNDWTHLAVVMNATNAQLSMYIDGALAAYSLGAPQHPITIFGPGSTHLGDEVTIGAERSTGPVTKGFVGFIDEIKFGRVAVSGVEIGETFNDSISDPAAPSTYTITYKSGWITPEPGADSALTNLAASDVAHVVVQFSDTNAATHLPAISASGATPLYRVSPVAYAVRGTISQVGGIAGLRYTGLVPPSSKISNLIGEEGGPSGMNLLIQFYDGISVVDAAAAVTASGANPFQPGYIAEEYMVVTADEGQLALLASQDQVAFISIAGAYLTSGQPIHAYVCNHATGLGPAPFVVVGEGWDGPGLGSFDLTYRLGAGTPDMTDENAVMVEAFAKWAAVAALTFTETATANAEDSIDTLFGIGEHGDGFPFAGELAHAFLPDDVAPETFAGDAHFDDSWAWVNGATPGPDIDLRSVALHEFGHSIGMGHSEDPTAIMAPFYQPGLEPVELTEDDIEGVLTLYGMPASGLDANFRFDDGGVTAEDFTEPEDWLVNWLHAGILDGAAFTNDVPPLLSDSDGDGIPNYWETAHGLNPVLADDGTEDPDLDGLTNFTEYQANTHPFKADSNLDGQNDNVEDNDGDTLANEQEQDEWHTNPGLFDTDDDGISDGAEVAANTSALYSRSPLIPRSMLCSGTAVKVPEPTEFQSDTGTVPQRFESLDRWVVGAMVKPAGSETGSIILRTTCGFTHFELRLDANVPTVRFHTFDGVLHSATGPSAIPTGEFTEIYGQWDPVEDTLSLIVNDCVVAAVTVSGTGVRGRGYTTLGSGFVGNIDDVFIGSDLLTEGAAPPEFIMMIDHSGSMSIENRMQDAKDAAKAAVDLMPSGSQMALIQFDDTAQLLSDFTTDRDALKTLIDGLQPVGGTDYEQPILQMIQLLTGRPVVGSRVGIFISDGVPQSTATDDELQQVVELSAIINTVGFGSTILAGGTFELERLALLTGGQFFAAPSGDELAGILGEIVGQVGQNQFGYYPFDDDALTAEDFLHPLDQAYALKGVMFDPAMASTNINVLNSTFADAFDQLPSWWLEWFLPDSDATGISDDPDGDGVGNLNELRLGLSPRRTDSDGDGTADGDEDVDGDSLINRDEESHGSRPDKVDTDDDGLNDNAELADELDPLDASIPFVIRALDFTASSGLVTVPEKISGVDSLRFSLTNLTVECIVRPGAIPPPGVDQPLIVRRTRCDGLVNFELGIRESGGAIIPYARFNHFNDTNTVEEVTGSPITMDGCTWTHLAASLGDNVFTLFKDGIPVGSHNTSFDPARGPGDVLIGDGGFVGQINEIRIWKIKRRAVDIQQFRDRSLFFDASAADPGVLRSFGDVNGHLREIAKPGSKVDQITTWTLECWVRTSDADGGTLISRSNAENGDLISDFNFFLGLDAGGRLLARFAIDFTTFKLNSNNVPTDIETTYNATVNNLASAQPINDGTYHHVAYTRDDDDAILYIDGVIAARQPGLLVPGFAADRFLAGAAIRSFDGPIRIGHTLDAEIDEVRIWNVALSAAEVLDVRSQNLVGDETGLITYFNFDFQQGQFAEDRAVIRDPALEFGVYIPAALRLATEDQAPIQNFFPLRVYIGTALQGYFPADDGGTALEDFVQALDSRYYGVLSGSVAFTNVTTNCPPYTGDSDGDGLPDWWETLHGLNPGNDLGDDGAWGDPDLDGLNNKGEYLAGTDPRDSDTNDNGILDYDSTNTVGMTFGELYDDGDGISDAWEAQFPGVLSPLVYDAQTDSDNDGWDNSSEFLFQGRDTNGIPFTSTDPTDIQDFPLPPLGMIFKYNGTNTGGRLVVTAFTKPSMDGPPDAILDIEAPTNFLSPYTLNTNRFTSGHIRQGPNYFYAWFDNNSDGTWTTNEPAGLAEYQPLDVCFGGVSNLVFGLTDTLPGFARFSWTALPGVNSFTVRITRTSSPGAPVALIRSNLTGRTYFHEGDYRFAGAAGQYGLDPGGSFIPAYQAIVNGSITTNVFSFDWQKVLDTPKTISPIGDTVFSRISVVYTADYPTTIHQVEIRSGATNGAVLYTAPAFPPFREPNSTYKYALPIYPGDGAFTNGTYFWRMYSFNPARASTASQFAAFNVVLQDNTPGASILSGSTYYYGKVSNGKIVVQALTSPGFCGIPAAQVTQTNKGLFTLRGIVPGTYYLLAFIDQNANKKLDTHESFGFVTDHTLFENSATFRPLTVPGSIYNQQLVIRDHDADNDQIPDAWENQYFGNITTIGPGPLGGYTDFDGDTLNDFLEYAITAQDTDPTNPDTDGDGLTDGAEYFIYHTNPMDSDTDDDGLSDGFEVNTSNSNPLVADSDGDGVSDGVEVAAGSSPNNIDSDGDGFTDALELVLCKNASNTNSKPSSVSLLQVTAIIPGTINDEVHFNFVAGVTGICKNVQATLQCSTNAGGPYNLLTNKTKLIYTTNWFTGPFAITNAHTPDTIKFYDIRWKVP